MLEALSIHDKTLWYQKLTDAIVKFNEKDQQQKVKKEAGLNLLKYLIPRWRMH